MTDTTGCCGPGKVWTPSGHLIDVMNPAPALISIVDIAYNLSRIPRWNGSTMGPVYSVAQHSCMVCDHFTAVRESLKALLHDAHEYLLGDMPRPLKLIPGNHGYLEACRILQEAIEVKFGCWVVGDAMDREIKLIDSAAARGEAMWSLRSKGDGVDWGPVGVIHPHPAWDQGQAMYEFLWRFEKYHKPRENKAVVVDTTDLDWWGI